jgi:protein-tyrosine phosphatase
MHQITDTVWLGDIADAMGFKGQRICVLESMPPRKSLWIPVLQFSDTPFVLREQLDVLALAIDWAAKQGPVLVYCGAGIERSPLGVAWWLHRGEGIPLAAAYARIKQISSKIQDRTYWLEEYP